MSSPEQEPSLAVFTTVYPAAMGYVREWYRSVRAQSDQDFRLWIAVDAVPAPDVLEAIGGDSEAVLVHATSGDSPATVRQRALERIVQAHTAVVLTDSDDVLREDRVEGGRAALVHSNLNACALELVDARVRPLGFTLTLSECAGPGELLPAENLCGLSNTTFCSDLLRRCLPIPPEVELVDWFLATRAWLLGAEMSFDPEPRMKYRQHGQNMAACLPPFSEWGVERDTHRLRVLFDCIVRAGQRDVWPDRWDQLRVRQAEIERFYRRVVLDRAKLSSYVEQLNQGGGPWYWGSAVANSCCGDSWLS